jgi:hypothetical protein
LTIAQDSKVGAMCEFVLFCPPLEEVAFRPEVDRVEVKVYFIIRFNFKVYFSDYPPSPYERCYSIIQYIKLTDSLYWYIIILKVIEVKELRLCS